MERKMPLLISFLTHPIGVYHSIKPNELVTSICQTQHLESTNNLYEPSPSDIVDSALFTVCGTVKPHI